MNLTKRDRAKLERFARLEDIPMPERFSDDQLLDAICDAWNRQTPPIVGVIEFGKPPK